MVLKTYFQGRNRDADVENRCVDPVLWRKVGGWIGRLRPTYIHGHLYR